MSTAATTGFWQDLIVGEPAAVPGGPPFSSQYPVHLPGGRTLILPIRPLPDGRHAVASLIANQASFTVTAALAAGMANLARPFVPGMVVGLPTLGLTFAPLVAEGVGHTRFAPLGYSRKFWYDDALSEPVVSITSPGTGKRLYLDPNLLPLVQGRRVCVVDDAISSGSSILAALRLLARVEVEVVCVVVAMKQTRRWETRLLTEAAGPPPPVKAVFGCPMFARAAGGWHPLEDTHPSVP